MARLRSRAPACPDDRGRPDAGLHGNGPFPEHLRRSGEGPPWVRLILVDECSRPERPRRVRADAAGLRRARGRSRGSVGPAAHQDRHRSTIGELQSMPAIVPSGCFAIHRATARNSGACGPGASTARSGKTARTAGRGSIRATRASPAGMTTCSSLALAERLRRCVAFNPSSGTPQRPWPDCRHLRGLRARA
jgi:hypothetical protein